MEAAAAVHFRYVHGRQKGTGSEERPVARRPESAAKSTRSPMKRTTIETCLGRNCQLYNSLKTVKIRIWMCGGGRHYKHIVCRLIMCIIVGDPCTLMLLDKSSSVQKTYSKYYIYIIYFGLKKKIYKYILYILRLYMSTHTHIYIYIILCE